jgi:hypothetical protein
METKALDMFKHKLNNLPKQREGLIELSKLLDEYKDKSSLLFPILVVLISEVFVELISINNKEITKFVFDVLDLYHG